MVLQAQHHPQHLQALEQEEAVLLLLLLKQFWGQEVLYH
jgi:hypothetical protein